MEKEIIEKKMYWNVKVKGKTVHKFSNKREALSFAMFLSDRGVSSKVS